MEAARLPARIRLAALAALLAGLAVTFSVAPFVLESEARSRRLQEQGFVRAVEVGAAAVINPDQLAELAGIGGLTSAALVDDGGQLLAVYGRETGALHALAGRCPWLQGTGRVFLAEESEDSDLVGACARMGQRPELALAGLTRIRTDQGRRRRSQVLALTLAFSCLAGGVTFGAMQRFLSPLQGLAEGARRLARGDEAPSLPQARDPEFQVLTAALEQLAEASGARQDAIRQRLEVTRELAAVVAHEVRNPLQSISMLADVVAHEDDPAERRALLRSIQQELGLIEVVARRLVDSGDTLHLVRRSCELSELLRRCQVLQTPRARELGVQLQVQAPEEVSAVVDAALARRAVENLVSNALDALRGGSGTLVRMTLAVDGEDALIRVEDDGPGVPEGRQEEIFRLGVTGRPTGSGLGLPLARAVAQAHGGTLSVEQSASGGASFELRLPLQPSPEST